MSGVRKISCSKALLADSSLVFIDVRQEPELYSSMGHIASSHHVELPHILNDKWQPDWDRTTPLVVVCRSGGRATTAAQHLLNSGWKNVSVLEGGMLAWNKTPGCPTVRVQQNFAAERLRDAVVSAFSDACAQHASDPSKCPEEVRKVFDRVAGSFEKPDKSKFGAVVRELAVLARQRGQPPEVVTATTAEMLSLLVEPTQQIGWMRNPGVKCFFHDSTGTCVYVVSDVHTKDSCIIDPVLDYAPNSGRCWTAHADSVLQHIRAEKLRVRYILETHVHADHLTAAQYLKAQLSGSPMVCIGRGITKVQETWKEKLALEAGLRTDGSQFDRLLNDGDELPLSGSLSVQTIFTPGHTPDSNSYLIGDAVFVGDTVFMPDQGAARCDFPNGSATELYDSVHSRLYNLPNATRCFVCHDYKPGGRPARWETTIGEQKRAQKVMPVSRERSEFIHFRQERDKGMDAPKLLYPSVQFNLRGGSWGPPDAQGRLFMKVPVSRL
eukprot:TRINITY_DN47072_c0_g1_i1.p1 TRINITY_DN47072_c0_g1~~TRINITY_DN47072_c0_g1_i1.p1  ORF type:complete len:518 (+),score=169.14 TRINITY_DN47072_c0_g1_i1:69-1556(+)